MCCIQIYFGATLAFQLLSSETHKHHLSPAFNPGKSQFGFGVIKSFPFNEYSKTHLSQLHKQREFRVN
jgi:hypothetical protein